eukprot:GFYU01003714.1.p1 GENE.GFYU01003714.1~~GFYU01003714.1.p1  ORF type:complete len:884 (-),score=333.11 GFYU01003714.1:107-2758(-)
MNPEEQAAHLLEWVKTAPGSDREVSTLEDLQDGVVLYSILAGISHKYFDVTTLKTEETDNPIIQSGNARTNWNKLVMQLSSYYKDVFHQDIGLMDLDVTPVSKGEDVETLVTAMEFVVYAALQCDHKEDYITVIMSLPQDVQTSIMILVQQTMAKFPAESSVNSPGLAPASPTTRVPVSPRMLSDDSAQVSRLQREKDEMQTSLDSLEKQHDQLMQDYKSLQEAKEQLEANAGNKDEETEDAYREELEKIRKTKDSQIADFQHQLEEKDETISSLEKKLEEVAKLTADNRSLTDELDIMKSKVAQMEKLESQLEKYKRKIEESSDMRKQMKSLEEQNEKYLRQVLEAEGTAKKIPQLKAQVDTYREQVTKLESQATEMTTKLQKKDVELSAQNDELEMLKTERGANKQRIDELKEQLEDHQSAKDDEMLRGGSFGGGLDEMVTPEMKEKLIRLEQENEMLKKSGGGGGDEHAAFLQTRLDDEEKKRVKFEQDYLAANQKVLESEATLKKLNTELHMLKQEREIVNEKATSSTALESQMRETKLKCVELESQNKELQDSLEIRDESLKLAQQELVGLKSEHKLLSMDKTAMLEEINTKHAEELKATVDESVSELKTQVSTLSSQLEEKTMKLAETELSLKQATAEAAQFKENMDSGMREINDLLKEKDSLNKKYIEAQEKVIDLERDATHAKNALHIKTEEFNRLKENSDGPDVRIISEDVDQKILKLQLQQAEYEKEELRNKQKISDLQTKLKEKISEISVLMKEKTRLEGFLKQAKSLITDLQHKAQSQQGQKENAVQVVQLENALSTAQTALMEKDKEIQFLKRSREETKECAKREEKLIISAFYEIGLEIQRLKAPQRGPIQTKSFLGRQRQALKSPAGM